MTFLASAKLSQLHASLRSVARVHWIVDVSISLRALVALVFKTKGALMTKRSFVAAAALTSCITGSAMAADMPAKAYRSFPAEVFSWSGFYVGHLVR
jgi:hypothetical protein